MSNIILRTENLSKTFVTTRDVKLETLKSVNLQIVEGKITMIIGASGAGKSTFLHLLGGLDRPNSGQIFYADENILNYSDDKLAKFRNKNIGFVFQFHHLLPEFTAIENVAIPQMIFGKSLAKSLKKAESLLGDIGLKDRQNHKPAELSGGEQQRVAIARALANDPRIILADEPTGNLDTINSQLISDLIVKLNERSGMTFVVVTHNKEMMKIAHHTFQMKDGILTVI